MVLFVPIISFVKVDVFPQIMHRETENVRKVVKENLYKVRVYRPTDIYKTYSML